MRTLIRCVFAPLSVGAALASVQVTELIDYDKAGLLCPYTLLQIGGPRDGELLVGSESWVGGNVGKAKDDKDNELKVSSSTITGEAHWETDVNYLESSSTVLGGNQEKSPAVFDAISDAAHDISAELASHPGTSDGGFNLNNTTRTITGNGGVNIFHVTSDFVINNSTLTLNGGPEDVFVFNIPMEKDFQINSNAEIALSSEMDPRRVIFNVLGDVEESGPDTANIQESTFRGTLLAPGRNVNVGDNEYDEGHGLYGSIITGGKLTFQESDITHECFNPLVAIPEPGVFNLLLGTAGLLLLRRKVPWHHRHGATPAP